MEQAREVGGGFVGVEGFEGRDGEDVEDLVAEVILEVGEDFVDGFLAGEGIAEAVDFVEDEQNAGGGVVEGIEESEFGFFEGLIGIEEPEDGFGLAEGFGGEGFVAIVEGVEAGGVPVV